MSNRIYVVMKHKYDYGSNTSHWRKKNPINIAVDLVAHITAGIEDVQDALGVEQNIYTSDFPSHPEVSIFLFADDAAILVTKKKESQARTALQEYLLILEKWLEKWRTAINTNKSQAFIFKSRRHCLPNDPLQLFDRPITWTNRAKYLGFTLDFNLTYSSHLQELKDNYWKKYFSLINWLEKSQSSPSRTKSLSTKFTSASLPFLRLSNLG
ncbi:RNA-directed DNA polymerase from mobile element jockey [Trichonephila inaurata madagascariensis]|uniref:RNA-directed DNA polymerase from mobile element jockey n=1 Tax=Trichonephila inaurata madagascariensis TaxID=2747483 RepID=A0A8X6XVD2_9ARAC|nr:RNA-directed DNA polymerase from mobile element jockey [Trichonephila inaurata madagascariensis]